MVINKESRGFRKINNKQADLHTRLGGGRSDSSYYNDGAASKTGLYRKLDSPTLSSGSGGDDRCGSSFSTRTFTKNGTPNVKLKRADVVSARSSRRSRDDADTELDYKSASELKTNQQSSSGKFQEF